MKKILSMFLCTILLVLTSCGERNEYDENCNCNESSISTDVSEVYTDLEENSSKETISELESRVQTSQDYSSSSQTNSYQNKDNSASYDSEVNLADKIIKLYLKGDWDGFPTKIDEHEISISRCGELLIDGYLSSPSRWHCQHPIDLPDSFNEGSIDSCNTIFIPGQGTYVLIDETYIKYLRGKKISEGSLKWKNGEGIDKDYGHAILHYVEYCDKMFLTTPMLRADDGSDVPSFDPIGPTYLYIFPDYNVAEIEFVGRATDIYYDEYEFKYIDENGFCWKYYEEDGKYFFEKSYNF